MKKTGIIGGLLFLAALASTGAAYWAGLAGPLILDDFANLDPLRRLDSQPAIWWELVWSNESGPLGRPVSMLSFVLERLAYGGEVAAFKYNNLMLHLLSGALVFWLAGRLFRETSLRAPWVAAAWVAAAWLLAPLFASTVLYVVQRMAQLAAVGVFAGLLCYTVGRQQTDRHPKTAAVLVASAFVLWTPLAALAKENGILLPLLALVVEAFLFRFRGPAAFRRYLVAVYVLFLAVPAVVALYFLPQIADGQPAGWARPFTVVERLLSETRIVLDYAAQLIVPRPGGFGVYHDDYPLSRGLLEPVTTLTSLVTLLLVTAGIGYSLRTGRLRPLFFGLGFFLARHALESTVFMLEPYFEHRNYLPGFGLFFACGFVLFRTIEIRSRLRTPLLAAALAMTAGYGIMTHGRAQVWSSVPTLLADAATYHPHSARLNRAVAVYSAQRGDLQRALGHAERVRKFGEGSESSLPLLSTTLYCLARKQPDEHFYETFRGQLRGQVDRQFHRHMEILSRQIVNGECRHLDIRRIARTMDAAFDTRELLVAPGTWKPYAWMAKVLGHAGLFDRALAYARKAAEIGGDRPVPHMMTLHFLLKTGELDKAREKLAWLERRFGNARTGTARSIAFYRTVLETVPSGPPNTGTKQ